MIPDVSFGNPHFTLSARKVVQASAGVGLTVKAGIGVGGAASLTLNVGTELAFRAQPGVCTWDVEFGQFSVEGDLLDWSISSPPTPPLFTRQLGGNFCASSGQVGGSGGGGSGGASPPANSAPPLVNDLQGNNPPKGGDKLEATQGSWSEEPTGYLYEWERCKAGSCEPDPRNANSATFIVSQEDTGYKLRVSVTASNSAGSSSQAFSPETGVVGGSISSGEPQHTEVYGPTTGPAGLLIPFEVPPCQQPQDTAGHLVYWFEGGGYDVEETEVAAGTHASWTKLQAFTIDLPVGAHRMYVRCEDANRATLWEEDAFTATITESAHPVTLTATTAEPGESIGVLSGAPDGPSPCPNVGVSWTKVAVFVEVDGNLESSEFFSLTGAIAEKLSEFRYTIPAALAAGDSATLYVECQNETPTWDWNQALQFDPAEISIGKVAAASLRAPTPGEAYDSVIAAAPELKRS